MMHPDGLSSEKNKKWSKDVLKILSSFEFEILAIYPCNDIGHKSIVQNLKYFKKKNSNLQIHKNINHNDYIKLLKGSDFLIGNSSSGIIESTFLKIPAINLGNRQGGRLYSNNIIHSNFNKKNIIKSINYVFNNKKFKKKLLHTKNIFYKKNSGYLICKILDKILNKKINFKMEKY